MTYVYLIGSKAVLYPLFSSSFLLNIVIICYFNMVKTLDMVESGYSWTLTCVRNTVESGHYLYFFKAKMEDRK